MTADKILILDFGSPTTQLVARRVRALQAYCEILPCTATPDEIRAFGPRGVILSGGLAQVPTQLPPLSPSALLELDVPLLALGHGFAHLIGDQGAAGSGFELVPVASTEQGALLAGMPTEFAAWTQQGVELQAPAAYEVAATAAGRPVAFAHRDRPITGLLFHPEARQTEAGDRVLERFLDQSGCAQTWTMAAFAAAAIERIRAQVGEGRVICGLSGGVDSSVTALLIHRAIGDQLQCIFVDHGLLRKGERDEVREMFVDRFHVPLRIVDVQERFLGKLAGVADPEEKRKIIGHEFISVFDEAAQQVGDARYLAQGTVYADVVESVSLQGNVIKSHHNVGGLPDHMKLELVEPLRQLFKDEVRALGRELGMPEAMVERQPFPGPGLAIRCLGAITPERVAVLQEADAIVREEIERAGLHREVWQGFAVLLPVKTVGNKGMERTYEETCAVRAVGSEDAMTAQWSRLPHELLDRISSRICAEVRGIGRVVYDITSKPPGTIEWE
jgi:GMP synthase (glutamine-hydrolysing)